MVASLFWSDEINCCYTLGPVYCSLNPSKNLLLSSEATTWPGYPSKRWCNTLTWLTYAICPIRVRLNLCLVRACGCLKCKVLRCIIWCSCGKQMFRLAKNLLLTLHGSRAVYFIRHRKSIIALTYCRAVYFIRHRKSIIALCDLFPKIHVFMVFL